jgi:sugar phosphate isomerase/epimerase
MNIDMNEVAKALKEINYQGDITLEACYYLKPEMDLFHGIKELKEAADKFRKLVK